MVNSLCSVNSSCYFSPLQWRIHPLLTVLSLFTELKSVCEACVNIRLCFGRAAQLFLRHLSEIYRLAPLFALAPIPNFSSLFLFLRFLIGLLWSILSPIILYLCMCCKVLLNNSMHLYVALLSPSNHHSSYLVIAILH